MVRIRSCAKLPILVCVLWLTASVTHAATVQLFSPRKNPSGPVQTGMLELERVFKKQGWIVRRSFGASLEGQNDLHISVMPFEAVANTPKEAEKFRQVVPNQPQSYAIIKSDIQGNLTLTALGSDPVGAMYAAYDLAEQVERTAAIPIARRITEQKASPSIPNRGIQLMLHKQSLEDPFSWYHSEPFWKGFFETIARNRFNYLELQGVYDLITTGFSNVLPYVTMGSGMNPKDIERNQRSFRRILEMARAHGVTVSLINSGLDWGGQAPGDMERAKLQDTLVSALSQLLQEFPSLDALGFMVDDSSLPADFYQNSYVKAVQESEKKPALVLHTWAADPAQVNRLIENTDERILLELKFNGDHLGLPYPVTGGRMREWSSYSYLDYFKESRKYGLLFQLPFNGTHRVFPWGDTVFIRRTLENTLFAGANGFVLQTYSTYLPHADAYTNPIRSDLRYYDWTYERDWYWYLLWGRLAYDLELPTAFFERKFQEHFGSQAGTLLFDALQKVSQTVPALASTCFRGPGMREFAPELEPPLRIADILQLQPLDSFTIRSVSEEIELMISSRRDGRYSPLDILNRAAAEAGQAVALTQQAGESLTGLLDENQPSSQGLSRDTLKEWNAWLLDFQSLSALGRYWRDQVSVAVQTGVFLRTGDIPSLVIASDKLGASGEAWKSLQEFTALHYRPLLDTLRNKQSRFHWKLLPSFENEDRLWITQMYNEWLNQTEWPAVGGHFPLTRIQTSEAALLTLSIPPKIKVESLVIQYQNQQGESARFPMTKTQLEGVYFAEIPPKVLVEGIFQYFFMGRRPALGEDWIVPDGRKPFSMVVSDDAQPPFCANLQAAKNKSGTYVFVTAKAADASGIDTASVWWKRFPSNAQWVKAPMEGTGEVFQGMFPITGEGAQFAIEMTDHFGNILRMPDMKTENPYRIIPPSP